MSAILGSKLAKGKSFADTVPMLDGLPEAGKPLKLRVEPRAVPYLDHAIDGWVDGPPTSNVAWLLSGREPGTQKWRRFTITKVAPWTYELGVFPTPFPNANDPLAPGVPPSSARGH
jgi:hypothetical protein